MLVDGIFPRSFVKEPISCGFGAADCSQRSLEEWSQCCVIALWTSINAAQGTALLRKVTRCVPRWGNFPTPHAATHPSKKMISLGSRCLKDCPNMSKHPSERCDQAGLFIGGVIWGALIMVNSFLNKRTTLDQTALPTGIWKLAIWVQRWMNYVHAHQILMSSLPLSFPSPHILIICQRFFRFAGFHSERTFFISWIKIALAKWRCANFSQQLGMTSESSRVVLQVGKKELRGHIEVEVSCEVR